jgi:hypothetical protein
VQENCQNEDFCFVIQENDPKKSEYLALCKNTLVFDCETIFEKRNILLQYIRDCDIKRCFVIDDDVKHIRSADGVKYSLSKGLPMLWEKFANTDYPVIGLASPGFCFGKMKDKDVFNNGCAVQFFYLNLDQIPEDITWGTSGSEDTGLWLSLLERGLFSKILRHYCYICDNDPKKSTVSPDFGFRCKLVFDVYKQYGDIIYIERNPKKPYEAYPYIRLVKTYKQLAKDNGFKREFSYSILRAIEYCENTDYKCRESLDAAFESFQALKQIHEVLRGCSIQ